MGVSYYFRLLVFPEGYKPNEKEIHSVLSKILKGLMKIGEFSRGDDSYKELSKEFGLPEVERNLTEQNMLPRLNNIIKRFIKDGSTDYNYKFIIKLDEFPNGAKILFQEYNFFYLSWRNEHPENEEYKNEFWMGPGASSGIIKLLKNSPSLFKKIGKTIAENTGVNKILLINDVNGDIELVMYEK